MRRAGYSNAARIAARNKSIREDPRINAELASEHGLTVGQIRRIRNRKLGGGVHFITRTTQIVSLRPSEKKREKILTFWGL